MLLQPIFEKIYRDQLWGDGTSNSPLSGAGSEPNLCKPYVKFVSKSVRELKISEVVDVGHGDWAMWRDFSFPVTEYKGFDVVPELSDELNRKFNHDSKKFYSNVEFVDFDFGQLLLCKDVLQHLSNSESIALLGKFQKYRWIIICNDYFDIDFERYILKKILYKLLHIAVNLFRSERILRMLRNNREIESGQHRNIDILKFPFKDQLTGYRLIKELEFARSDNNKFCKKIQLFEKTNSKKAN